jgi:hypothetical protein
MTTRLSAAIWTVLLIAAGVNLAAGARRPLRERAMLSAGHYPAADRAAEAVRRLVPPDEPLTLVTYDGDMLDQLNCAVWAEYRLRWLLYPRRIKSVQIAPGAWPREPGDTRFLFFRVTAPPQLSERIFLVQERGPMWVLAVPGMIQ